MNLFEMQKELIRIYDINEALIKSNNKLQDISMDIASRNNDIKGLNEIQVVLKKLQKELNKIN